VIDGPFYTPGDLTLISAGKGSTVRWTEPPIAHEALYVTAVEAAHHITVGESATPLRPSPTPSPRWTSSTKFAVRSASRSSRKAHRECPPDVRRRVNVTQ